MKRFFIFLFVCGFFSVFIYAVTPNKFLRKEGAAPGHTGSPGDSLKDCTVCHGGDAIFKEGWVVSTIPASGYVPGERYRLTATNTELSATRFGFQVSPQDEKGNLLGTLIATDTIETQLVGNDKYITYKEGGIAGVDSRSWTFDWIAPSKGTGEVVFYAAFNSNADNHKENDKTFLSKLVVGESGVTGVEENTTGSIVLYPNPAQNILTLQGMAVTEQSPLKIFDMNGNVVAQSTMPSLSIAHLSNGTYYVRCSSFVKSFVKQ